MTELPADLEALLVEQIADRKRGHRRSGMTMLAIFLPLALLTWLIFELPERNLWTVCFGCGLLGIPLIVFNMGDPRKAKPLDLLRRRAKDIVWMHVRISQGNGTMSWVRLYLADGKIRDLPTKNGAEERVLGALAHWVPQATTGFSPKHAAQFKEDPTLLRHMVTP